jgi:Zn-finger nucleic acid-binding protein
MEAATLRCPGCGAPASTDLHGCTHCGARLATAACPSCFGMVFRGTAHCPHCGARADRAPQADAAGLPCPHCRGALAAVRVGPTSVRECGGSGGLWLDNTAFDALCADRERQASVLAFPAAAAAPAPADTRIRYRSCPECGTLMHRTNFQRVSGVVLDVCRQHGTWFDADELRRIVEFIQRGGLEVARDRERMRLEEERRRLEQARRELLVSRGQAPAEDSRARLSVEGIVQALARLF